MAKKVLFQTKLLAPWTYITALDQALGSLDQEFLIDVGRTEIRRAFLRWQGITKVNLLMQAETELSLAVASKPQRKKAKKK